MVDNDNFWFFLPFYYYYFFLSSLFSLCGNFETFNLTVIKINNFSSPILLFFKNKNNIYYWEILIICTKRFIILCYVWCCFRFRDKIFWKIFFYSKLKIHQNTFIWREKNRFPKIYKKKKKIGLILLGHKYCTRYKEFNCNYFVKLFTRLAPSFETKVGIKLLFMGAKGQNEFVVDILKRDTSYIDKD